MEEIRFFDVFKKVFNKTYPNPASEHLRLLKFLSNQNEIEEHNHNYEKGRVTYLRGLWKYSDLSSDEVDSFMNGFRMPVQSRAMKEDAYDIKPPKALNWVKKGYVSTGELHNAKRVIISNRKDHLSKSSRTVRIVLVLFSCWSNRGSDI